MANNIDIIIYANNAHKKIEKTLLSICAQTFKKKIKVYIIDDYSKEDYNYLIKQFQENLKIIIIRNDKKLGTAISRNLAMKSSKSENIMFLTAGDIIKNAFTIETLVKNFNKYNIIIGALETKNKNGEILYHHEKEFNLQSIIFKRAFLEKYSIVFPNVKKYEDKAFLKLCLLATNKICYIDDTICFNIDNEKSQVTKYISNFEEFKRYKLLIDNTILVVDEAEKRKFDKYEITDFIDNTLIYLFFAYQKNFFKEYAFVIFEWLKPLMAIYKKNKAYLNIGNTHANYLIQQENWGIIPQMTLNSFIRQAIQISNLDNMHYKQNKEMVSIIIPVYNREKYLRKTLESIINQSYKNLEIIIVNDCSTDNSEKICIEYAKKDKRIKYIKNEKNSGVSKTRNNGLDIATGKYIGFVDSDDYIEKDMYRKLVAKIQETNSDFVQCSTPRFHESNLYELKQLIIDSNNEVLNKYFKWNFISCMVWDKLFTKEVISNTRFEIGWIKSEDAFFTAKIATKANRVTIIPDNLYHYKINTTNSLTKKYDFNIEAKYSKIYDFLEENISKKYPDMLIDFYKYKITGLTFYIFENLSKKNIIKKEDDIKLKKSFIVDTISTITEFINNYDSGVEEYYIRFIFELINKISVYLLKNIGYYKLHREKENQSAMEKYLNQVIKIYKKLKKNYPYVLKSIKKNKHWIMDRI